VYRERDNRRRVVARLLVVEEILGTRVRKFARVESPSVKRNGDATLVLFIAFSGEREWKLRF